MLEVLAARDVLKRYGGVVALDHVDFAVRAGAVNVLIGENGAGKSTLMRILAGVEAPTSGTLILDGEPVSFGSVRDASARGVGIVHQELNLCPNLTVADNIFLGRRGGPAVLNRDEERRGARALLDRLEQAIDPDTPVGELRVGQQQIVEIARALSEDCRVLIMDEPTSALSAAEVEVLFRVIAELKRSGVAIVYISHRLEELLRIGDVITVMRDGRIVDSAPRAEVDLDWVVRRMLGEHGQLERLRRPADRGRVVLRLDHVSLARSRSGAALEDLSATFHAGEVTALYGLLGSGRTELFEIVCGARRADAGAVLLNEERLNGLAVADRSARGVFLVPEDRQREGLFTNLSVGENLTLSDLRRLGVLGAISKPKERAAVNAAVGRLGVKAASPDLSIRALSGGNQQKVVIGRALMPGPALLLLDEPSRGVDVGARAEVFATMQRLAGECLAVVFATSDLMEACTAADRILVLCNGRISLDVAADAADEAALVRAANRSPDPAPEAASA